MNGRGTRTATAAAIVVAVSLVSACSSSASVGEEQAADIPTATATPARPVPSPTPVVDIPVARATLAPPAVAAPAPVALRISSIDADLPVEPVGVQADGSMEIPRDPAVAGWYRYGPVPGADVGSAVLAAHVDSRVLGVGPLARLRDLDDGARVEVRDADGETTEFIVASVQYLPRATLSVKTLFARTGEPALVIITCGGSFDEATRSYSDNVVAVAHPAE